VGKRDDSRQTVVTDLAIHFSTYAGDEDFPSEDFEACVGRFTRSLTREPANSPGGRRMQILVGWDDPTQAELLSLYLDVEENTVQFTTSSTEFISAAAESGWDVVLMVLRFPDPDTGFETFLKIREVLPACPVVGVCDSEDTFQLARFISAGLRSHVMRDSGGDFVFLLPQTLQSAVQAVRAEHDQKLAERLREEIDSVRKLQESIIPKNLYTPQGYGLTARYEPSQISVMGGRAVVMAGGDYYDVFSLDDEHLVILLGDASGHGMKACMSIMTMHTLVRMIRGREYSDTAQFVFEINQRLCEQGVVTDEGGFITLLYAVLNPARCQLEWTSAGHPLPIVHWLDEERVEIVGKNEDAGLPLGIYPDVDYESHTTAVAPRTRTLLYTDGLAEAFPSHEDYIEFGVEGIKKVLLENAGNDLESTLQALFDASHEFTKGTGRHDDTSVVLMERR
jgi:serine phosphatase RsbU (regulator of sigma subunit)